MARFLQKPIRLMALDADTRQPINPFIGVRSKNECYSVEKDRQGRLGIAARKAGNSGSNDNGGSGDKKGGKDAEPLKKGKGAQTPKPKSNNGPDHGGDGPDGAADHGNKGPAFTSEEDKQLQKMKADGKTWKEIATAMGRPQNQIKPRFKELNKAQAGEAQPGQTGKKGDSGDARSNAEGNKNPASKNGKNEGTKKGDSKGGAKGDSKGGTKGDPKVGKDKPVKASPNKPASVKTVSRHDSADARYTGAQWRTLHEDGLFSYRELQILSELLNRDGDRQWLRIASAFFDITGRRVSAEDIHEKFEA